MPRSTATATRDRMLDAGAVEILARGYAGATLSSIAARVGVTKGALTYHFPSKVDFATAMLDHLRKVHADTREAVRAEGLRGLRGQLTLQVRIGIRMTTDLVFAAAHTLVVTPSTGVTTIPPVLLDMSVAYAAHLQEAIDDGELPATTDANAAGEDIVIGQIGTFVFLSRQPDRSPQPPYRVTRHLLTALGAREVDRLVDQVLAAESAPRGDVRMPRPAP
ncbi:TetR family transcriptional regulator [Microbacterium koreense]|uniref:TetR family transcriptional regulator n=1 Tax=Microbacterium koreense TaxID=323761 RepID=A0ABW2ZP26_9MICO